MPQKDDDELLTLDEIAKYLKVSTWTIHRFIRKGRIPCYKMGHQWRFRKSLVNEWLERKRIDLNHSVEG